MKTLKFKNGLVNTMVNSCNSLVRACSPLSGLELGNIQREFRINFRVVDLEVTEWVHFAETTFYDDNSNCPSDCAVPPSLEVITTGIV